MGLVSFELATVFLGGDNSLSQPGTWKCRGYVSLWKFYAITPHLSYVRKFIMPEGEIAH
jgi:hypothetical protein